MGEISGKNLSWQAGAAAVIVAFCWGGNFAASKFAMAHMDPFLTVWLRFFLLSLMLAPLVWKYARPNMQQMFILSIFSITIHFAFIFYAIWAGLSVTSAIIAVQMGVPFSCLMAAIFYKDYLGPWRSFGLLVSFAGLLVVSGTPNVVEYWWPFMLGIVGALGWACANTYMKHMEPTHVVNMLFWPGLMSLPQMGVLSYVFEDNQLDQILNAPTSAWLGIAYSAVFSSVIGYGLWMSLLKRYTMSQVVPFSLLAPMVGIASGVLIFHDPLGPLVIGGSALTVLGVAIISIRRPRLTRTEPS